MIGAGGLAELGEIISEEIIVQDLILIPPLTNLEVRVPHVLLKFLGTILKWDTAGCGRDAARQEIVALDLFYTLRVIIWDVNAIAVGLEACEITFSLPHLPIDQFCDFFILLSSPVSGMLLVDDMSSIPRRARCGGMKANVSVLTDDRGKQKRLPQTLGLWPNTVNMRTSIFQCAIFRSKGNEKHTSLHLPFCGDNGR